MDDVETTETEDRDDFAPDPSALEHAVAAQAREIADLRCRITAQAGFVSGDAQLNDLAERLLERMDMLMSLYRDGVERELAVMRDALLDLSAGAPVPEALSVLVGRSAPPPAPAPARPDILFDDGLPLMSGSVDIKYGAGMAYAAIREDIEIALDAEVKAGQLIVAEGVGAQAAVDLLRWQISAGDAPVLGRYEIRAGGRWRFVGRLVRRPDPDEESARTLRIAPTRIYADGPVDTPTLRIGRIGFPTAIKGEADLPLAVGWHVAGPIDGFGWHWREIGGNGPYRWMSDRAGLSVDLQPGPARRIMIVGENSVPYVGAPGDALTLTGAGQRLDMTIHAAQGQESLQGWTATAALPASVGGWDTPFEFIPAPGMAKSPRDYLGIDDGRILSLAMRAVAWDCV